MALRWGAALLVGLASCDAQECYEADKTLFPSCSGYEIVGYTCIGDLCVADQCLGSCTSCADMLEPAVPDTTTGRCILLTSASPATASPTPAPLTLAPPTPAPPTLAPPTPAPPTPAPPTLAPPTPAPPTPAPWTPAPWTPAPWTPAPPTPAPSTPAPPSPAPVTATPTTPMPVIPPPTEATPLTSMPASPTPATATPSTLQPGQGESSIVCVSLARVNQTRGRCEGVDGPCLLGAVMRARLVDAVKLDLSVEADVAVGTDCVRGAFGVPSGACGVTVTTLSANASTLWACTINATTCAIRHAGAVSCTSASISDAPVSDTPAADLPTPPAPVDEAGFPVWVMAVISPVVFALAVGAYVAHSRRSEEGTFGALPYHSPGGLEQHDLFGSNPSMVGTTNEGTSLSASFRKKAALSPAGDEGGPMNRSAGVDVYGGPMCRPADLSVGGPMCRSGVDDFSGGGPMSRAADLDMSGGGPMCRTMHREEPTEAGGPTQRSVEKMLHAQPLTPQASPHMKRVTLTALPGVTGAECSGLLNASISGGPMMRGRGIGEAPKPGSPVCLSKLLSHSSSASFISRPQRKSLLVTTKPQGLVDQPTSEL
eukprot:TRINITY_DN6024_c0_g1_i1.p1 TRINITY_DN6024_c0_g1~~TRINITY_DN6024_c0_g1_i1.p1  ORF type:complete len:598 (+),score=-49.48 TRINITY_DN6024_c0_g1_i1:51-1844(+)